MAKKQLIALSLILFTSSALALEVVPTQQLETEPAAFEGPLPLTQIPMTILGKYSPSLLPNNETNVALSEGQELPVATPDWATTASASDAKNANDIPMFSAPTPTAPAETPEVVAQAAPAPTPASAPAPTTSEAPSSALPAAPMMVQAKSVAPVASAPTAQASTLPTVTSPSAAPAPVTMPIASAPLPAPMQSPSMPKANVPVTNSPISAVAPAPSAPISNAPTAAPVQSPSLPTAKAPATSEPPITPPTGASKTLPIITPRAFVTPPTAPTTKTPPSVAAPATTAPMPPAQPPTTASTTPKQKPVVATRHFEIQSDEDPNAAFIAPSNNSPLRAAADKPADRVPSDALPNAHAVAPVASRSVAPPHPTKIVSNERPAPPSNPDFTPPEEY